MKIKICGLNTLEHSLVACEAGADMLGFNFYKPSPRFISVDECREIIMEIKRTFQKISCVGVFVNHSPDQIRAIMTETGLDLAQLSGDEPLTYLDQLGEFAFKALRPESRKETEMSIKALPARLVPPAFLLDKYQEGAFGGTGMVGNWELAAEVAKEHPVLLAGGLNSENVGAAIKEVQPWGVDVASGVEIERGRKDPEKIKDFIRVARTGSLENN
jgi:phosphoribosylanthranilate isomerase